MADAMRGAGHDPAGSDVDAEALGRIGSFVELHVEQGRRPRRPWARRWASPPRSGRTGAGGSTFTGEADHAGTTRLEDRADPMLTSPLTVLAARKRARLAEARVTVGRLEVEPNGTNAIPSSVRAWLDARAADEDTLAGLVDGVERAAAERAGRGRDGAGDDDRVGVPEVRFDGGCRATGRCRQ